MLVTLIGKKTIYKIKLPQFAIGNYWITDQNEDKEKKLVNIEGKDGQWQIVSNNHAKIVNPKSVMISNERIMLSRETESIIDVAVLKEYSMHCITIGNSNDIYIIYCSPVFEENYTHLDIAHTREITIGSKEDNDICYNNALVADTHAKIIYNNGRWALENFDAKLGTFVNDSSVFSENKLLQNGDVIFIMGLKIIIVGNSIFINNPNEKVKFRDKIFKINETKEEFSTKEENEEGLENIEPEEEEYYSRAPRIRNKIEHEIVKIDPPPQANEKEDMSALLVLGSTISMGLVMMISMGSSISGITSGQASVGQIALSLFTTFIMLVSMILIPMIEMKYSRRQKRNYEKRRQTRYRQYINSKAREIDEIMKEQRKILSENYVSDEECSNIILSKNPRLWERKIEDFDFLTCRLGTGDLPLDIDIQYPEKQFTMYDDELEEILNTIATKSKTLEKAPITLSLVDKNITGIISNNEQERRSFVRNLILQLITFQSYEDLKLVFLMKKDNEKKWEYLKMLPHVWDNANQIRFFADDYDEMSEISSWLEEEIQNRAKYENTDYRSFSPYYLIITDDYKKIKNLKAIQEILKIKNNIGFSLICMADNLMQLPNESKTFIRIDEGNGAIFQSEMLAKDQRNFKYDVSQKIFFEKISQTIANIPIKYNYTSEMLLPNSYSFLEMYDVGLIEQLNVLERWKKNNPTLSLRVPVGVDGSGVRIMLDIHEKFHGPHGLIAGSTGSGKSEFIITYILSLAVNYHPDDLAFILIDYKGGGLAGAFQKREVRLPHLVGTITNIDTVGLQRSLASIQSELRRRQIMFNEARNKTDEGTIDIYKYQKLYHDGIVSEPIPHLLIICDEFAELKQQQEDFMDELISVARIGRSLGVHLILATQKPAGIVNDQIRSNSKFAICLKVQDISDSMDVIKRPEAANLKNAGQFFMQVGNDEYFILGQSAWSGAPYFPSDITKKKVDNSIEFISNIGTVIKKVDDLSQKAISDEGEQLTNIVRYIYDIAKQENIEEKQLWLESIPETIYIKDLKKKYNIKKNKKNIELVIGEFDDPYNQRQGIVDLNLSENGNTLIYGSADSGKETLLSTIIYDTITTYTTDKVQMYILDFGSEALKIFKGTPHIGDIIFMDDTEKTNRFFDMLQKEIKRRKQILSDYGGDYNLYVNTTENEMPTITVIINNYEAFSESTSDKYEDILLTLTREGIKCGIVFIMTVSTFNDVRYRLSQNFKQRICLQLNNDDDYYNIFEDIGKKRPSHIFGRGLINPEPGVIYEFQTAKICEPEEWNAKIKETIEDLKLSGQKNAEHIPILPNKVVFEDVVSSFNDISTVPLGITKKELKVYTYDFKKNFVNIITAKNLEDVAEYIAHIIEELKYLQDIDLVVIDAEKIFDNKKQNMINNYQYLKNNIGKTKKETLGIIIGIDKLITELESGEDELTEFLNNAEEAENFTFIIVENSTRLKNHEYDEWYKTHIPGDTGIWIGNGVDDQYLINVNTIGKDIINICGSSFGYVINQGDPIMIKLLGIKEKEDEDE